MKNDLNIIDATLNRMSYEISLEFPELDIIWIPHTTSERKNILNKKIQRIDDHIGGRNIIPSLTLLAQDMNETDRIAAINIEKNKNIFKRQTATAGFFLNIDNIEDDFSFKHMVYIDIYILLCMLDAPHINFRKLRKMHGNAIEPLMSSRQKVLNYTGADCFAAICLSLQGHRNAFTKIAKIRAREAMETIKGTTPEKFAFPLILDLAQLIYKNHESKLSLSKKTDKLTFTPLFNLAKNISVALDLTTAKSWETFARNTQLLAWQNIDARKILGAATFTCEDPFLRSNAYLVSEMLNIEPALSNIINFYNPFAEEEINEKNHKKLCQDYFEVTLDNARKGTAYDVLKSAALEQNERFLNGDIMGWSAPALIKLSHYCENNGAEKTLKSAEKLFTDFIRETSWGTIKKAGEFILREKQKLKPLSTPEILEYFNKNDELRTLSQTLSYSEDSTHKKTA